MTTSDPSTPVDDIESTTQVGDSFRDAVCQLLRTQFPDAKPEQYVGGTKVDILFTNFSFGKREVIAVECKNYEKALSKSDLEREIYPKYNPLLERRLIDDLIVVSRKPIGSAASSYIQTMKSTSHQTLEELEESLLGIRQYVEGLAELRPTDDAQYIEGRFAGQEGAALARVEEWVSSTSRNGLAILGSYGQGKSSLARRIAAHYAKAYLHDQTGRIPIRKTLGDVVHETRLEALFGAEFTADFPLRGYQFKTFDHLNQSGRLLVILDGFDEMKHAMTASDFNEYRLYEHFIQSMVERDTLQKRARKGISLEDRLQFQRNLAWWAWRRQGKAQGSFFRDEIPDEVLTDLPSGNAADLEGKRNEYIVSTLTEEKEAGFLYFAHRSFQEFLVAERLRTAKPTPGVHAEYAVYLTPDIISFLIQAPETDFIFDWYDTLTASSSPLPASYLGFFLEFPDLIKEVTQQAHDKPYAANVWTVTLVALASRAGAENGLDKSSLPDFLYEVVRTGDSESAAVAVLALMPQLTDPSSQPEWLPIVSAMIERSLKKVRIQSDSMALSIESKRFDFAAKWLAQLAEKIFPSAGKQDAWRIQFDAGKLVALCIAEINGKLPEGPGVFGDAVAFESAKPVSVEALKVFDGVDAEVLKPHEKFLRKKTDTFSVVSLVEKRSPQSWAPTNTPSRQPRQ